MTNPPIPGTMIEYSVSTSQSFTTIAEKPLKKNWTLKLKNASAKHGTATSVNYSSVHPSIRHHTGPGTTFPKTARRPTTDTQHKMHSAPFLQFFEFKFRGFLCRRSPSYLFVACFPARCMQTHTEIQEMQITRASWMADDDDDDTSCWEASVPMPQRRTGTKRKKSPSPVSINFPHFKRFRFAADEQVNRFRF